MRLVILVAIVLPIAALAQEAQMPRMMKGMGKGQWRVDMLENSAAPKGQKMPAMTICSDNLAKHSAEKGGKTETKCKQRLVKDAADEAVMEMTCPERTVTTTMKRESDKAVLMDIKSAAKGKTDTIKLRYTSLGACAAGQSAMSMDKTSEQCKKIQASAAKMDPAKQCAGAGGNREQCESMLRQQIAQMKAMCG